MSMGGRNGHGLIGYGIKMYKPLCAFSCRAALSGCTLKCSKSMDMGMDGMDGMDDMIQTSSECYATDDAFLQSMAYCISVKCTDLSAWQIEKYWEDNIAGADAVQPDPKWTYQATLEKVTSAPTETAVSGELLNKTMLVSEVDYVGNWNAQDGFEHAEDVHEKYS
jgi:hypothetical protein